VLLADDHELFRSGLRALLQDQPEIEVVVEVANGRDAVEAAAEYRPDIVIMDLSMPGMNGMEATRRIGKLLSAAKVLCLSMHADRRFVASALDAGASGYLVKECALDELLCAIDALVAGQVYLSPRVARAVVEAYRAGRSETETSPLAILTDRERDVLQLLAEGESTKQIAARLHVSVKTVGTPREHLMEKLGIHSVAGLTRYAIREGIATSAE